MYVRKEENSHFFYLCHLVWKGWEYLGQFIADVKIADVYNYYEEKTGHKTIYEVFKKAGELKQQYVWKEAYFCTGYNSFL